LLPPTVSEEAQSRYERFLEAYLSGELRLVNSGLARERRPLAVLLREEHPSVHCSDGSDQALKRAELRFLAGMLDESEQEALLLPIIIEVAGGSEHEASVLCTSDVELKVLSQVLGMPVEFERPGRVRIYRPQLGLLRKRLRTTTQYAFSARTGDESRVR
jgi:uncharacterized protein (UPF0216 family)